LYRNAVTLDLDASRVPSPAEVRFGHCTGVLAGILVATDEPMVRELVHEIESPEN
jgi:hypothetical protein